MDDPYFAERYAPTVWVAGEGMGWSKETGLKAEKVLGKDGAPFPELIAPLVMSKSCLKVSVGLFPGLLFIWSGFRVHWFSAGFRISSCLRTCARCLAMARWQDDWRYGCPTWHASRKLRLAMCNH
eukprot:353976-Chlamydomonas_euryale.AAC.2